MEFKINGSAFRFDLETATVVDATGEEIAWFSSVEVRDVRTSRGGRIVEIEVNDGQEVVAVTVPVSGELEPVSAAIMACFGVGGRA